MCRTGTYNRLVKSALIALLPVLMFSCKFMKDDLSNCGLYLEFIYDYNMEQADAFSSQVSHVDLLFFNEENRYLFSKHALREELIEEKRMFLRNELGFGKYKILTVAGLTDHFRLADAAGYEPVPEVTTLEEIRLSLKRASNIVSQEFPDIWLAPVVTIEYKADLSVWPVHLTKNSNRFNIVLTNTEGKTLSGANIPYSFEIETPEGAIYGYDNSPQVMEKLTYTPYYLAPGEQASDIAAGRINTMRLFNEEGYEYKLNIRNTITDKVVWEYDLMTLLRQLKLNVAEAGNMSLQEFLDRESKWNLVILFREEGGKEIGEGDFIGIKVVINGWLIWENEIGI